MDKLKGICILVLTFFSFGLTVFFMPFQVYEVFSALDSEVLEAEIIDSEFDRYPLWQDSWHYLIFNQLGGSGVNSASLFRRT